MSAHAQYVLVIVYSIFYIVYFNFNNKLIFKSGNLFADLNQFNQSMFLGELQMTHLSM